MASTLVQELRSVAARHLDAEAQVALAPGRVNLIGEHTDYNEGFVLPMAIDRHVGVAFAPHGENVLHAHACEYDEAYHLALNDLTGNKPDGWARYVAGMAWAMQEHGIDVPGAHLFIKGTVPIGAGLSSSAALEMAVGRALCELAGASWKPVQVAKLGQRAENDYVGVSCGIMDQFASAVSEAGCALLLDCRSLETETVPLPDEARVVVMDTGVRRSLSNSAYNERRAQCQAAVEALRAHNGAIQSLRDVPPPLLEQYRDHLSDTVYRRAAHVVSETQRPLRMAEALRESNLKRAGTLMKDSHESLRDLYEVSSPELDCIVEAAQGHSSCYGARLTGAGMGGCAVALIQRSAQDDFIDTVRHTYQQHYDHPSAFYPCPPSGGAHLAA